MAFSPGPTVASAALSEATALQDEHLADRPISSIRFEGLEDVPEQKVWNNIRSSVGNAYDPQTARGDVSRLNRLGSFQSIDVESTLEKDGTISLVYVFKEQQRLAEVQVVGNRALSDQALLGPAGVGRGVARDDFLIERSIREMKDLYAKRGYYLTEVSVDAQQLEENDILIFEVIEGPRVRVYSIEFDGNMSIPDKRLHSEIKTRTWFPFFRRGELDTEMLSSDVTTIDTYYKDRGYLDVRVDHDVELSSDQREAKVIFLIQEGREFTVGRVTASSMYMDEPLAVFSSEQLESLMELKIGDRFQTDILRRSVAELEAAYGTLGYLDARVDLQPIHGASDGQVDVNIAVSEGAIANVGLIKINGNFLTKDKVIRRHIKLQSGRRYDATELELSKLRIQQTQLFNEVKITPQQEDPDHPGQRDVLVEVEEKNTGSFNFGVGFGSDSGVLGSISLVQNNFDIADFPETFGELYKGRAFRGAGQKFSMNFQPGDEIFAYDVNLTEPNIFETVYSLGESAGYYQRYYDSYREEKMFTSTSLSRRFGDIWSGSLGLGYAHVRLGDFEYNTPVEIRNDRGPDNLWSTTLAMQRTTITRLSRPGSGSRLVLDYTNYGALLGDVEFNRARVDYTTYLTINRDFLGRTSTLRLDGQVGWIFSGEAPTFERFYLGGRTLRGFEFRDVSPKGTPALPGGATDVPIGGDFMAFLGAQYQFPLLMTLLDGVVFIDSGTVNDDFNFDEYRVAVGIGIRLYIPQLGPTPMAFDFAFPLAKQENDRTEVFSFSAELPF
ncbi:MAG: outer membrane protein assembly factor BamA [Phycisphaerales bacterium]|nr:outer membrane protein assembly factor BamA [Phycisphaerales bacterium]